MRILVISGSTGIIGAADTNYVFKRKRSTNAATLLVSGRDTEYQELTLQFNDLVWELVERKNSEDIHKAELPKFLFRVVDFIGYSPGRVARPYELLTIGLNLSVLLITLVALFFIRRYYMEIIISLFPEIDDGSMIPSLSLGLCLFVLISCMNVIAVRHKIVNIWRRKE